MAPYPDPAQGSQGAGELNPPSEPADPPPKSRSILGDVRFTFVTGLILGIPFVFTVWILKAVIFTIDGFLQPIFRQFLHRELPGVGFLAMLVLFFVIGLVGRNVPGRILFGLLERMFRQIPVVRSVYNAMKELLNAVSFEGRQKTFREVCIVEYPRTGLYSMGFVTNQLPIQMKEGVGAEMVTVYLPSPPNPTTGVLVIVPLADVHPVDMTIEDGLKMMLSGGIVSPDRVRLK
jgi:uncharacterized membrane protein